MSLDRTTTRYQIALVTVFLIVIGLFFLGSFWTDNETISRQEKRALAPLPPLPRDGKSLGTFPKAFERYYQDHFPLRQQMVTWNALLRVGLFRRSPAFDALVGSDGWYYLNADGSLHDFLGRSTISQNDLGTLQHVIEQRQQWLASMGAHYLMVVVPNKQTIYPEYLPERLTKHRKPAMLDVVGRYLANSPTQNNFLDLTNALLEAKTRGRLYFKTDAHWNSLGAYVAYTEIVEHIRQWYPELRPIPLDRLQRKTTTLDSADIARVMGLVNDVSETTEELSVKSKCAAVTRALLTNPLLPVKLNHTKNGCARAAPMRVLFISDSFGIALNEYLSETFNEVVYDRELEFNEVIPFMRDYRPDVVVHLHVARYLGKGFEVSKKLDEENLARKAAAPPLGS
jgi:hypothetical protein